MRILIGCEFSGVVRDAFIKKGHDVVSCDLLDSEKPGPHIKGDVLKILDKGWDMAIFHPPCTHLAASGARWFKDKKKEQEEALNFVRLLLAAPIEKIALENPVGIIATRIRKSDQIIQPYMFGDPFMKTTCLWLKNLSPLYPTNIVEGREQKCWKESKSPERWKNRSRTYSGIAEAMSNQWG
jgi:hypothetical protein